MKDMTHVTRDMTHITRDMTHITRDMTHVTRDMTHVTPFVSTHLPLDPVVVDRYIADLNIEVASFDDDALLP